MFRKTTLILALGCLATSGCGSFLNWLEIVLATPESGSPELKAFESERELKDYFDGQITGRNSGFESLDRVATTDDVAMDLDGANLPGTGTTAPPASPISSGDGATSSEETGTGDFSQTTVQEFGVDEGDVVKTDGTHFFVMSNFGDASSLRIVRAVPADQLAPLSEVELRGRGREIYLHDGLAIALTERGGGYFFIATDVGISPLPPDADIDQSGSGTSSSSSDGGEPVDTSVSTGGETELTPVDAGDTPTTSAEEVELGIVEGDMLPSPGEYKYERPQTTITIVDVSIPTSPLILSETTFDGSLSSSRLIEGVLHLVVSNFQEYYYDILPFLGRPELDTAAVPVEQLLPTFEQVHADGTTSDGPLLAWNNLYRPVDPDGFGVVSVISLDIDAGATFSAVGVVAEPGLIYSSLDALYITDTAYNFSNQIRETTDIYKFTYSNRGSTPTSMGSVPGRVLNQYSMSEHNGHLRVATTINTSGGFGNSASNAVFVLGETDGALNITGQITGIAPNEHITSARFLGNRGYLVTFERIDPLHTLDLSDPTNPLVVGELEIPGFSTFIVPIDQDHLLTIGQYTPADGPFFGQSVQLSIFDVSDFSKPTRSSNVILGGENWAWSEAVSNPKAFTYYAELGLVAFPVSIEQGFFILEDDFIDGPMIDPGDPIPADGDIILSADDPPPDSTVDTTTGDVAPPPNPERFEGLVVYNVSIDSGLTEVGRISTLVDGYANVWPAFTRGIFIGDDVFAVTHRGVFGAPQDNLESAPHRLIYDIPAAEGTLEPSPQIGK